MFMDRKCWFNVKRIHKLGGRSEAMPNYSIGLQLYTLRDLTRDDLAGTLREVAAIGYQGVEFAGYGGLKAEELKSLLEETGLKAVGSHVPYERLLEAADEEIAYMKALGGRYIAVPYLAEGYRKGEVWREVIRNIASLGERCRAEGIQLLYHNHHFEFLEHVDGRTILDDLFASVSSDALQVELDACWAYAAGYDPVAYVRKYKDRLPLVHFKDYRPSEHGPLTVELGTGIVPLKEIAAAAADSVCEWLIVEQDVCTNPPLDSVRTSYQWIKANLQ